jgi:hypothetical protein
MLFMIFDENKNNEILAVTHHDYIIIPRQVLSGEFSGLYAVPTRILQLERYNHYDACFDGVLIRDSDPDTMWPEELEG